MLKINGAELVHEFSDLENDFVEIVLKNCRIKNFLKSYLII